MQPFDILTIFNNTPRSIDSSWLYEKLEDKIAKNKLDKLIFVLDSADGSQDGNLDFTAQRKDGLYKLSDILCRCFKPCEEIEEAQFSLQKMTKYFGGDFSKELQLLAESLQEIEAEDLENEKKKLAGHFANIPPEIINKIPIEENQQIEAIDSGYKVIVEEGIIHYYDSEGEFLRQEYNYPNGLKVTTDNKNSSTYDFGKTSCVYEENPPYIEEFTVNKGLSNETTFEVKYNEDGEAIDVIPKDVNPIIKIDEKNKNVLIGYINSTETQVFGENFDITSDGISVNINPIFADDFNPPESIKNEIKNLIAEGKIGDYKLRLLDDGRYELSITSLHGLDYKGDGKHIIFSPDGKTKTTYYTEGETITITTEQGRKTKTETFNRKEFFSQDFDENDPVKSYCLGAIQDFYSSDFEDYFDLESKPDYYREEIVAHSFKLEDFSEIKAMISETSEKYFVSETEYSQTVDNTKYTVKKINNGISVTVNDKTYQIDLTGIDENLQQILFKANPKALARIGEQNIKLEIISGGENGLYDPEVKTISMNPNIQNAGKFLRSLVHETGHSYYTHVNPVNKEFEATYKKELEYFKANCGSKNLKSNDNCAYAASNVYEMVAECYTLLTNGNAKSEFVIANYFPETLKIVKSMIE